MKRITANHYQTSERYYKLPKLLFESERYKDMKLEVKVAYAVLKDYTRLHMDTSSSLSFLSDEDAMRLIEGYGPERLMFGTDYPLWVMEKEIERFFSLPLTDTQRRQILFGTFSALFHVPSGTSRRYKSREM